MSTRTHRSLTFFVHAAWVVVSLLSGSVASGAGFTWDASGGTPLNDGGGAWNATGGTNWFDGTSYGAWGNTSADTATFGVASGAAGTITVGNVTANAITFNAPGSGNYTLSSGTITLAGASPTITVNASGTTTISSVLTGSSDWTKSGTGALFLSNAATTFGITGTTTVNGGVLALNGPLAPNSNGLLGNSAGFVINDGGTIRVESWNALMGYNSSNVRPVTVNAGGLLTMTAGNTAWIRGPLTLAGGTLAGGFALEWGGWNLGNATTTVTENSTISGSNVVLSNATANVFDVAAGKTLSVTGNFGFGSDPGSKRDGNLTKSGAGTMTLAGANTYTGTTSVNAGTLQIGGNGTTGSIAAASAVTGSTGAVLAFNRTDNYGGNFSNIISGGLGVTINSGALTLTGSNSFSGDTLVNSGTLVLGQASALGGSTLDTAGTGSLSFGGLTAATFGGLKGSGGLVVTNTAGTAVALTVGGNNQNATYSGTLSGLGSLTKVGTGTMTLAGANTHTGTTTVSAGALRLDNNLALQNSVPSTSGGGSLALGTGITTPTIGGLVGSTNVATAFGNWSQVTALALNPLSGTATYTGVIANGAAGTTLTKTGAGTQVLQQSTNTYTGTTTVNGGVLALNGDNTSTGILGNSAGFVINDGGTIRVESWNALMGFNSGNVRPVTVNAGGLLTMTAGNTAWLRGALTLAGGTLAGGASADYGGWALGNATTTVTENSTISGSNVVLENTTANVFDVAAGKTLSVTGNFGFGTLSKKNGNLTKSGAGTMTLAGANAYTGTTSVNAGTLQIGNGGTVGSISGSSVITGSAGAVLAFNRTDNYGGNFSNTISGGLGVRINSGALTLTGSNSFSGDTLVNSGTLVLGQASALGGSTLDTAGTGSLSFGGLTAATFGGLKGSGGLVVTNTAGAAVALTVGGNNQNATYSGTLSGLGSLTKIGTGTMTLAGANTYTGTTTVSAGALRLDNNLALQNSVPSTSGGGSLALGTGITTPTIGGLVGSTNVATAFGNWSQVTALTLNPLSGTATYTGVIADGVAGTTLTKTGAGTQVLESTNTYTGITTVNEGLLVVRGANTVVGILGNSAGFVINNGGSIRVDSWNALMGYDPTTNVRPVTVNAGGLLTMTAGNTAWIKGTLTLAGGTLAGGFAAEWGGWTLGNATTTVTENSTISGENVVLANTAANVFDVAAGKTLSVTGNFGFGSDPRSVRNGNLTKSGAGTMTLAGANAYTGTTTIQGGTLQIGNSGTVGSISGSSVITGSAGAVLAFNRTDNYGGTFGNTIGGAMGLTLNSGTLTLSGSNTFNGTTKLVAGALTVGNANALQNSTLDMNGADAGSITFSQNSTLGGLSGSRNLDMGTRTLTIGGNGQSTTYSGGLSNGALTKLGSGTLTLSGSNGYTGSTAVSAGVLRIGAGGAAGSLASSSISVANNALLAFNRSDNYGGAVSSVISGSGGVRVESGFLTLAGLNSYTGATDVLAGGTLAVNGSLANANLSVAAGATLMGSGTIAGLTTIAGLHLPGNSPGVETFTNLTYNSGAGVQWELWGNTASNSPTAFDQIVVNGDLTFSGATTLDLVFTGSAGPSSFSSVSWANAFWDSNQEWLLYDVAGTLASANNLTLNVTNWQDSTGAFFQTARPGSSFSVEQRDSDVYIVYAAVPEPSTVFTACIGIAIAAWSLGRRRPASQGLREGVRHRVGPDNTLPATQS